MKRSYLFVLPNKSAYVIFAKSTSITMECNNKQTVRLLVNKSIKL